MSKAFTLFYDAILPELKGCTTALVDLALKQVARDFCDRTSCWRAEFDAITSEADTLIYDVICPESHTELVRITRLTIDDTLVWTADRVNPDDALQPRYRADKPPFTVDADDAMTFIEQPSGEIVVVGAMRPTLGITAMPDVLYTKHLEAMRTGVLSRLMRQGGKPWTDRELSSFYDTEYQGYMNHAAAGAARGNTRAPMRTRASSI